MTRADSGLCGASASMEALPTTRSPRGRPSSRRPDVVMRDSGRLLASARARLEGRVIQTPLVSWGNGLWLKCENAQVTGSFKLRGALNKVLALTTADLESGVGAAS